MKTDPSSTHIHYLVRAILLAFTAVAISLAFWSIARAPAILARADNPRRVEAELRIQRGRIYDRHDTLLAESQRTNGFFTRLYALPTAGPAVGYYSFRYGTAGVEEGYDAYLRGESSDPWQAQSRELLHQPQIGGDLRLTLDATLQAQADSLLGDQTGALLLLQLGDGGSDPAQILALASHPGYDANDLDKAFETLAADKQAPLLNRATQGQYQPGLVTQPFILAVALEQGIIDLNEPVAHTNRPVMVNGVATYCATPPPDPSTWADVLYHRCPGPMLDLVERVDQADVAAALSAFGLTERPQLPLNTETAVSTPISSTTLALIGQDTLVVTPLQVAVAWAGLAGDGRLPALQIVSDIQDENGNWLAEPPAEPTRETAVPSEIARRLRQTLPTGPTGASFSVLVLSGPDGSTNAWYLGLAPAANPAYAVVVVLENSSDLTAVEQIGQEMLTAVVQEMLP
ncbi:MAG: hypothetical protein IPM39_23235 [Chloroflexi bacterium]|nr:hypothetical protein [Chloroflexota bacterium]